MDQCKKERDPRQQNSLYQVPIPLIPNLTKRRLLISTISQLQDKPSVLITASGMSYYGNNTYEQNLDESAPKGTGFLSDVTQEWENEAFQLKDVRVVTMRISMVLDREGGALKTLALTYKCFLGGVIGKSS
jgi:NAD dependent epimerase/dehydratase family enzyme